MHEFLIATRVFIQKLHIISRLYVWSQLNNSSNWRLHQIYRALRKKIGKDWGRSGPLQISCCKREWYEQKISKTIAHTQFFFAHDLWNWAYFAIWQLRNTQISESTKGKKNLWYYKLIIWVTLGRFWLIFKKVTQRSQVKVDKIQSFWKLMQAACYFKKRCTIPQSKNVPLLIKNCIVSQ